jgi:hypothetical protein
MLLNNTLYRFDQSRDPGWPRAIASQVLDLNLRVQWMEELNAMLWTIFVILLILWLLGLVTSYTLGGFIHILLVVAIAVALIQIISGRRAI